ncbi:GTP 3',8-cyclase MoaA [Aureibacillus halotolerans]|uniref:GTP 3',8-cyclase n=1 Tax=Aureibacillus halotolerans TaxID=1508390 RepID=A0A4R6U4U4_9BACI|nr:GTP 3',8-cyclase MoaA [Aureibacillus halotolerans]TDQ40736.1 cyclic pyranopterin monophosphate synthase subunit MoaA [Aureibacillus halotolerans]
MAILTDKLGRPLQDLRISVIDRCNLRCTYCMPRDVFGKEFVFMPKEQLLSFEEIVRLAKLFLSLGVKKIRLTGGEPLLRKDFPELVRQLAKLPGLKDIGLTTNGVLLGAMAEELKQAGLKRVNVSLDALDKDVLCTINDTNVGPERIITNMKKAEEAGLEVKVNMVVMKGKNEHEVLPMAEFFRNEGITLRFIEFMDVGQTNGWMYDKVVTKKDMYEMLNERFGLEQVESKDRSEVAKRYRYKGTDVEVGFITSVSESFCSSCSRARVAADGKLYNCLFASGGLDLREWLRNGATDDDIREVLIQSWQQRTDRYSDERTEATARTRKKIEMSYIGG